MDSSLPDTLPSGWLWTPHTRTDLAVSQVEEEARCCPFRPWVQMGTRLGDTARGHSSGTQLEDTARARADHEALRAEGIFPREGAVLYQGWYSHQQHQRSFEHFHQKKKLFETKVS